MGPGDGCLLVGKDDGIDVADGSVLTRATIFASAAGVQVSETQLDFPGFSMEQGGLSAEFIIPDASQAGVDDVFLCIDLDEPDPTPQIKVTMTPTDLIVDRETDIIISAEPGGSLQQTGIGGFIMDITQNSDVKLLEYEWLSGLDNPADYFGNSTLPAPQTSFWELQEQESRFRQVTPLR